jgi:Xaa-Pro dipeptidase
MWHEIVDSSNVDLERRIDWNLLRKSRLEKLWDIMRNKELDAILLTLSYNVRYATDFRPLFGPFYVYDRYAAIVPREKKPILFMTEPEVELKCVSKRMPYIEDVRKVYQFSSSLHSIRKWASTIKETLKDYSIEDGRLGFDYLSFMAYQELKRELEKIELVPAFNWITEARVTKHPEELKVMMEAVHIVEIGMRAALDSIREGMKEYEVGAHALFAMALNGMEVATHSPSIRAGENAAIFQRIATGKRIRNGETVIIDLGAMYGGYCADFCRTTVVGKPNDKQKHMFSTLIKCHLETIESIRPGEKVSEIDKRLRESIRKGGYPDYPGGTGHGIGMCLGEPPLIPPPSEDGDIELKPGMVICLEPGIFIPGVAGVKVEDMVLITEKGAQILTKTEYDEKLLY